MRKGKVYLIGAGPGDPGLLTLKGRDCLAKADIVVYDALINPQLLEWARPQVPKVYVGKRGGQHGKNKKKLMIYSCVRLSAAAWSPGSKEETRFFSGAVAKKRSSYINTTFRLKSSRGFPAHPGHPPMPASR